MNAVGLIARGDPITPGAPSELVVLAWLVGGFWVLVGAILLALWVARRQQRRKDALMDTRLAPPDDRDLAQWAGDLRAEIAAVEPVRRGRHAAS